MKKRKAGYYAVRVGRTPGVYEDWDSCENQVKGFAKCKYKKFNTRAEAENFVTGIEAENSINEIVPGSQVTTGSSPALVQMQALANPGEKQRHSGLPNATSKINVTYQFSDNTATSPKKETTSPSGKLTNPKDEVSPSRWKVTAQKEEVTSLSHPSTKNPSQFFKLIEENGQQFVFFESLERFDSYFETLCRTKYSSKPFLESTLKNHEIRTQNQTSGSDSSEQLQTKEVFQIEFDGASKGNPGCAGAGALIRCPHGSVVVEVTQFLGIETNNFAEYRALILGLRVALSKGIRRVRAQGDSQLVCLQVTGVWKVNEKLYNLHKEAKDLTELFDVFSIAHVRREYNSEADALANEAVVHGEAIREVVKPRPGCCLSSF